MIDRKILRYNIIIFVAEMIFLFIPIPYITLGVMAAVLAHVFICLSMSIVTAFMARGNAAVSLSWVLSFLLILLVGLPLCSLAWRE